MKKIISIVFALTITAGLTACADNNSPAGSISDDTSSLQSSSASQSTLSLQSTASVQSSTSAQSSVISESSIYSQSTSSSYEGPFHSKDDEIAFQSIQKYLDLKGEELVAKFEWPYDVPIDPEGMTAKKIITTQDWRDIFEDIPFSELSNKFRWYVSCDYGCLAMTPENGGEYEYKKYKAGDKIGAFIVESIKSTFSNSMDRYAEYYVGVRADFTGEATLTGEIGEYANWGELYFYPDEESRKKLPVVNFAPKLGEYYNDGYYSYDNVSIWLGSRSDHPEIDFNGIPNNGTRVMVKLKINKYRYYAECGLPFRGTVNIVDGGFEII